MPSKLMVNCESELPIGCAPLAPSKFRLSHRTSCFLAFCCSLRPTSEHRLVLLTQTAHRPSVPAPIRRDTLSPPLAAHPAPASNRAASIALHAGCCFDPRRHHSDQKQRRLLRPRAAHRLCPLSTGSAQWIETHRILPRRQMMGQSLAQPHIFLFGQETLEETELRPVPETAQNLMHLCPPLVVGNVIGDHIQRRRAII